MKNNTKENVAKVSRKPQFKGQNHPRNLHKAFRGSGNTLVISSVLNRGRGWTGQSAKEGE